MRVILPPYRVEARYSALASGERYDWGAVAYGIPALAKQTAGAGVRVAVLDTGVDDRHPDLAGQVIAQRDCTGRNGAKAIDADGHGTHCAGVIAASRNGRGLIGIAPDLAQDGGGLLIGKVLGDGGSGMGTWVAEGIEWALDQGADVISMSLGGSYDPSIANSVNRALAADAIVVCAAGNDGPGPNTIGFPAALNGTVAVGAVDRYGRVTDFSSRGDEVDIAAPGKDILSTWPGGGYATLSGTSMATPFVAGVVACLISAARRGLIPPERVGTPAALIEFLGETAKDAGPSGRDPAYGWGLIDPGAMIVPAADAPPGAVPPGGVRLIAGAKTAQFGAIDVWIVPAGAKVQVEVGKGR